jgi:hypothetical protein
MSSPSTRNSWIRACLHIERIHSSPLVQGRATAMLRKTGVKGSENDGDVCWQVDNHARCTWHFESVNTVDKCMNLPTNLLKDERLVWPWKPVPEQQL